MHLITLCQERNPGLQKVKLQKNSKFEIADYLTATGIDF